MPGANGANIAAETKRASTRAAKAARQAVEDVREALPELKDQAREALKKNAKVLKEQSLEAASAAGEQLETARAYVVERVQERPFTTTLAVLGAGFLLGMLVAGRRK